MTVLKELPEFEVAGALHPRRRMVVIQRRDGNFSFAEQYYYRDEYDGDVVEGWATLDREGIYETAAMAESEATSVLAQRYRPED